MFIHEMLDMMTVVMAEIEVENDEELGRQVREMR